MVGVEISTVWDVTTNLSADTKGWGHSHYLQLIRRPVPDLDIPVSSVSIEIRGYNNCPTPGASTNIIISVVPTSASAVVTLYDSLPGVLIATHQVTVGFYGEDDAGTYKITAYTKYGGILLQSRTYVATECSSDAELLSRFFLYQGDPGPSPAAGPTFYYSYYGAAPANAYRTSDGVIHSLPPLFQYGGGDVAGSITASVTPIGFSLFQRTGADSFSYNPSEYPWPGSPPGPQWVFSAGFAWTWTDPDPFNTPNTWYTARWFDLATAQVTGFQTSKWLYTATIPGGPTNNGAFGSVQGYLSQAKTASSSIAHFRAFTGRPHVFYVKAADGNLWERIYDTET